MDHVKCFDIIPEATVFQMAPEPLGCGFPLALVGSLVAWWHCRVFFEGISPDEHFHGRVAA